jgi:hypothetical protein
LGSEEEERKGGRPALSGWIREKDHLFRRRLPSDGIGLKGRFRRQTLRGKSIDIDILLCIILY